MKQSLLILTLINLLSCNSIEETNEVAYSTPSLKYEEINYFLHDTSLFTEGLIFYKGQLFESTGSPDSIRKSLIGINDLTTGKFIKKVELLDKTLFGKGIVFFKDKVYQLTYKNQTGYIYDANSFKLVSKFSYNNKEGWGLTTDGVNLIMSDGSDSLTYLNPDNLKPEKHLKITENGIPRDSLNELEYIKGYLYANIWLTNFIVKINPADGKVVGKIDLDPLVFKAELMKPNCGELNGIAYDSTTGNMYVTGKLWPHIYQIKLLP